MTSSASHARTLRQQQTDAERALWLRLRDRRLNGWKFKRQVQIDRFIADFCCAEAKLVIELDGGQHAIQAAQDAERTQILMAMGYLVLHFWNNDVLTNIDDVLSDILSTLPQQTPVPPHPNPLPDGERE